MQFQLAANDRAASRRNDSKSGSAFAIKLKERAGLIATKYRLIDELLDKMIASRSAQSSYQLWRQLESLRKRLKPKRTQGLTHDQVAELHRQQDAARDCCWVLGSRFKAALALLNQS